ncbi:unnamed protein product, partial [Phaeothamnion confervicola]
MAPASAPRIVSLLPSITEIIGDGLEQRLVGVTHECDFPPEVVSECARVTTSDINPHKMSQAEIEKAVVGSLATGHSLYGLREDVLAELRPTLVLTQALCDVCAPSFPVVLSTVARVLGDKPRIVSIEPGTLADVIDSVRTVGREAGAAEAAETAAGRLESGFEAIRVAVAEEDEAAPLPSSPALKDPVRGAAGGALITVRAAVAADVGRPRVCALEWTDPLYIAGHWVPDLIEAAGGRYDMAAAGAKSETITPEALAAADAEFIFVAPCGMDSRRAAADAAALWRHTWWRNLRAVRSNNVFALDGNAYYARPGPRLLQGCGIMAALLHGPAVAVALGPELSP